MKDRYVNAIVVQVHIPKYDVQGSLDSNTKLKLVELVIRHLRCYNPKSYIALSGHGTYPIKIDYLCNYVYWEPECRPLDRNGTVKDMPAQYYFVGNVLEHIKNKGFKRVLKTRGDYIISIPNINEYCQDILNKENKSILLTQQTGAGRIGDCFMYGDTDILYNIWNPYKPPYWDEGLLHTGRRFAEVFKLYHTCENQLWLNSLKKIIAFRDVWNLGFIDLRWNFNNLVKLYGDDLHNIILSNKLNIEKYCWGRTNNWLTDSNYFMEKEFYGVT